MTIHEYIKKAYAGIKAQPKKERLSYLWDYYKWHLIVLVAVISVSAQIIAGICTRKDTVFFGFLLNCKINTQNETYLQGFYDYAGINADKQEAAFYTDVILTDRNMQSDISAFQRILAGVATKETDFIIGPAESFQVCAYNSSNFFVDLRDFFDTQTLEKFSNRLYYIDKAVLEQLKAPIGTAVDPALLIYPDPTKPELMEQPIPVGIDISDLEDFKEAYYFPDTVLYFGIIANTPRSQLVNQFVEYLFKQ